MMFNGAEAARRLKKDVLGGYVRTLHRIDPEVATHILKAQRHFFEAGRAFFEEEIGHADRALEKISQKKGTATDPKDGG